MIIMGFVHEQRLLIIVGKCVIIKEVNVFVNDAIVKRIVRFS